MKTTKSTFQAADNFVNQTAEFSHMPGLIGKVIGIGKNKNCICFFNIQPPLNGAPNGTPSIKGTGTVTHEKAAMSAIHLLVIPVDWTYNIIEFPLKTLKTIEVVGSMFKNNKDKDLIQDMQNLGIACMRKVLTFIQNGNISQLVKYNYEKNGYKSKVGLSVNEMQKKRKTLTNFQGKETLRTMYEEIKSKPKSFNSADVLTGFHVWPDHSTGHLHMHVVYLPTINVQSFEHNINDKMILTETLLNRKPGTEVIKAKTMTNLTEEKKQTLKPLEAEHLKNRQDFFFKYFENPTAVKYFEGKKNNFFYKGLIQGISNPKNNKADKAATLKKKEFKIYINKRKSSDPRIRKSINTNRPTFDTLPFGGWSEYLIKKRVELKQFDAAEEKRLRNLQTQSINSHKDRIGNS